MTITFEQLVEATDIYKYKSDYAFKIINDNPKMSRQELIDKISDSIGVSVDAARKYIFLYNKNVNEKNAEKSFTTWWNAYSKTFNSKKDT